MAQRLQVLLVCDLDESETPGVETIGFAVDGSGYEIDVCARHAAELRDAFAPYVAAGRRAGRGAGGPRRRRGQRSASGVDPAEVRTWAREHNVTVSDRGRISADLLARYTAAKK
jgi:Lsr2